MLRCESNVRARFNSFVRYLAGGSLGPLAADFYPNSADSFPALMGVSESMQIWAQVIAENRLISIRHGRCFGRCGLPMTGTPNCDAQRKL